jgi:hypothetical protein
LRIERTLHVRALHPPRLPPRKAAGLESARALRRLA